MSDPIIPFDVWASGTNQNSIPANDNSLRWAILNGLIISDSTDAQPGSPSDGDAYIMTGAASGSQWATFDQYDLVIYDSGTWYPYAPVDGIVVNIAGSFRRWNGAAYVTVSTPAQTITESTTSRNLTLTDVGAYIRFTNAGTKTFTVQDETDVAIPQDTEVNGRNVGAGDLTIAEDTAVTITPPAGGTLVIPQGGTFTLKRVAEDEWDLFGVTVAA